MTDESKPLAFRLNNSPTAALEAKVEELAADGVTVYRLGLGEPDFNTPDHVKDAGIQAIKDDFSRYTATGGMQALRKAAADRLAVETGVTYQASETIVTAGAKQALFNALAALCPPGGEVLLPVPHWVSFPNRSARWAACRFRCVRRPRSAGASRSRISRPRSRPGPRG